MFKIKLKSTRLKYKVICVALLSLPHEVAFVVLFHLLHAFIFFIIFSFNQHTYYADFKNAIVLWWLQFCFKFLSFKNNVATSSR